MKSILISIRPEWVAKILNGDKTAEIRRTAPKNWVDYLSGKTKKKPEPMTGYIYCTKGGKHEYLTKANDTTFAVGGLFCAQSPRNGKVVGKFTLREVERINCETYSSNDSYQFRHEYFPEKSTEDEILRKSCISGLEPYLDGCEGYAWHISDLVIFDEPMELREFVKPNGPHIGKHGYYRIKRAPQSWCYVEVKK